GDRARPGSRRRRAGARAGCERRRRGCTRLGVSHSRPARVRPMKRLLKKLERFGRALAIRTIVALLPRRAASSAPRFANGRRRVLFLPYDRIGDMIVSTGLMRAIASSHPMMEVHVVASPENAPVLDLDPHVAVVIVFDRWKPWTYPSFVRRLRRARYDAV